MQLPTAWQDILPEIALLPKLQSNTASGSRMGAIRVEPPGDILWVPNTSMCWGLLF